MSETWKPVPGYEGYYEASSEGRIKSVAVGPSRKTGRVLKAAADPDGYLLVTLCRDGVQRKHKVHRLVAAAFYGPSDLLALHGDGDPSNNRAVNLRWGTARENTEDRRRHGTIRGWKVRPSHCKRGHLLSGDNLRIYTRDGGERWDCRACRRLIKKNYLARQRALKEGTA